jgi:hypothetical protein
MFIDLADPHFGIVTNPSHGGFGWLIGTPHQARDLALLLHS